MKKIAAVVCNGDENAYRFAIPPELVGSGFEVDVMFTRAPIFPVTPLDHVSMQLSSIEAALAAQSKGYDAVFINTIGDYALAAQRSGVDIPVVGAGQSAMTLATTLGRRFSIVSIWPPKMSFIYEELLKDYGLESLCASVRHVTGDSELATLSEPENFVTEMGEARLDSIKRIVGECRRAVDEDGADVIVLGCTCMSPTHQHVQAAMEVPVINGVTAGYKYTELLLSLGLAPSRRAYPAAEGDRLGIFASLVDAIGGVTDSEPRAGFRSDGLAR
ncbi:MAG: aspartate/glutamate racemase family protein [Gammaproteobacteria bacterium]|nr:aspartate/glutamate racemase family protein [Gammaproteobacteria bacterium]